MNKWHRDEGSVAPQHPGTDAGGWVVFARGACVAVLLVLSARARAQVPLDAVFGQEAAAWTAGRDVMAATLDGQPVLAGSGKRGTLTGPVPAVGQEIAFRFRLQSPEGTGESLQLMLPGEPATDGEARLFGCLFNLAKGARILRTAVVYPPELKRKTKPLGYTAGDPAERKLGWPDAVRARVEAACAAYADIPERWFTVRCEVRETSTRIYLEDRLLEALPRDKFVPTRPIVLTLGIHTALARVTVRPVDAGEGCFRPLRLTGHFNENRINGARVVRDSLPGNRAILGGVPFVLSPPDEQGRDHLDIGRSWMFFGALERYSDAQGDSYGGRWGELPGTRIRLAVPFGKVAAIHLLVAADDDSNSVPVVTAQFIRPESGFPKNFASGPIPPLTAPAGERDSLTVKLDTGVTGRLHHVVIPVDPGALSEFSDLNMIELELTKQVRLFRSYPDPISYSYHGAGLPSAAHIYAITLEDVQVRADLAPDKPGNVWTAPAVPAYTVTLRNGTPEPREVQLRLEATSHDRTQTREFCQVLNIPAGATVPAAFALEGLTRYGLYHVTLDVRTGAVRWTERLTLARLHPDTRERGDWVPGRGSLFGYWRWGGAHNNAPAGIETAIMGEAGAETHTSGGGLIETPEDIAAHETYRIARLSAFGASLKSTKEFHKNMQVMPEQEALKILLEALRQGERERGPFVRQPLSVSFFSEPTLEGPIGAYASYQEYWNEPPYVFNEREQASYESFKRSFLLGAGAVRKAWPDVRILLPHGNPHFCIPFVRDPACRDLVDGIAVDLPVFERLPEMQTHQATVHRMYQVIEEWKKIGRTPYLSMNEGPCIPTEPGAVSYEDQAAQYIRVFLLFTAYGVTTWPSQVVVFDPAGAYGEEHYGGNGVLTRMNTFSPKPAYAAYATFTRHLNRANFTRWFPTGSLTAYCLQFTHYRTGKLVHVLWTVRGSRTASVATAPGTTLQLYDSMDNVTVLPERNGRVEFMLTPSPVYLEGLPGDAEVALGDPDHRDAVPAAERVRLGNLGDASWTLSGARDDTYEKSYRLQIARFPGNLDATPAAAPAEQGGRALAVRLGEQAVDRRIMPYYTTLVPRAPVAIPGKASHLGLWVRAASDWGRVVYFLTDARGERWISIGTDGSWNCDDTHCRSYFNFDGWRYLRFEMPAHAPYDSYREAGTTWWGHYGDGDGLVDLPLRLDKIIVERRKHVLYVNDLQPANPEDVLLADLFAEYEEPADRSDEAVRLSRIRMPEPQSAPAIRNPIAELAAAGIGEPAEIREITLDSQVKDGTRCYVQFDAVAGAKRYDVWASPYPDGLGALQLGAGWTAPGQMIKGLRPRTDFYLFLVYTDAGGRLSRPSAPFKINLENLFGLQ